MHILRKIIEMAILDKIVLEYWILFPYHFHENDQCLPRYFFYIYYKMLAKFILNLLPDSDVSLYALGVFSYLIMFSTFQPIFPASQRGKIESIQYFIPIISIVLPIVVLSIKHFPLLLEKNITIKIFLLSILCDPFFCLILSCF